MSLFTANLSSAFKINDSFAIWEHFKTSWALIVNANKQKAIIAKFILTFFLPNDVIMYKLTRLKKYSIEFLLMGILRSKKKSTYKEKDVMI